VSKCVGLRLKRSCLVTRYRPRVPVRPSRLALFDPLTGGCCDGLQPDGLNLNQGAESTLAALGTRWLGIATRKPYCTDDEIALGPTPLETPEGWLLLYHGVRHTPGGCLYRLGLALLDLEQLWRVLRRSDDWIFAPEMPYERQGDVNGVVFPCGWILDEASGMIRMYYGGADSCLALATARLADVLDYVRTCPAPPPRERPGMAH
jgi:hypothetical protein